MVVANVTYVGQFQYLGSIMTDDGEVDAKVDKHLANASKAFGALRQGVFGDHNLSIAIKRRIYNTYVTRHEKTGLMYTKYTSSYYAT